MKTNLLLLTLWLGSHFAGAQYPVFQSKELLAGEVKTGYYVLLPTDNIESVKDSWLSFLQKQARVRKDNASIYQAEALNSAFAREFNLNALTSTVVGSKGFTKVFCAFESRSFLGRDPSDLRAIATWFSPFIEEVQNWQSLQLRTLELEQIKSEQKSLDREVARLQSSIERNLKQQNKLDQSIRQTPEELSKIIQEKETLTQSLIQQDQPDENLQKESQKMEKDIKKLRSQSKKNEKQLTSKEKALQKLRSDFIKKERERRLHQEVLESKARS